MRNGVQIDGFHKGVAYGSVAKRLSKSGMNVNSLRTLATLRRDEWIEFDEAVLKAAQLRLNGVADLLSLGLVAHTNGLGTTVFEYENQSDFTPAQVSMDAITRGLKDRVNFETNYLPLPIIHHDFTINARVLEASRNRGMSLDVSNAEMAARKVAEAAETMLFTGANSLNFGGGVLYGYTDFPFRSVRTLTLAWDDASKTGAQILADVQGMKQDAINDRHFGPFKLYVPTAYESALDDDYDTAGLSNSLTIRERILKLENITSISVSDFLTADNVLLVEMNSETIRMIQGLPVTTVEWDTEGGMQHQYKVMTILVPQPRADQEERSGIVHLS